jgi:membrane associated rhomboid family serine protease
VSAGRPVSDAGSYDPDNYCYRHPDRQSFILCQRCGRTICPECQTPAAVGVHCPECVREARASNPQSRRMPSLLRRGRDQPIVTYGIIALSAVVWILEWLTGGFQGIVYQLGAYAPALTEAQPWRMLTSVFLHSPSSILHLALNMLSLYFLGPALETMLGRGRFIALYLIAGFGGSVAVLWLAPNSVVVGASGAIFGAFAAYFVIARRLGGNATQILVVIGINLAMGFFIGGVSWQAHVGGLVAGAAVAFVFVMTRNRSQRNVQIGGIVGVAAVLVVLTIARVAIG